MRYTVTWTPKAEDDLAHLWMRAADKTAVNAASNEIDGELAEDPDKKGIEYFGDRALRVAPLWVVYRISKQDRIVWVEQVGWHP